MQIYTIENHETYEQLILNPDSKSHTSFRDKTLDDFFRTLSIPKNVNRLISIYIEYEFFPYLYEKHRNVYVKTAPMIQEIIRKNLDFGHAHLYHKENNAFYIVMFDVSAEEIAEKYIQIHRDLKKRKTIYHKHESEFRIYCGVYFSDNLRIDPIDFYTSARNQFSNTQVHNESIISILNLMSR